MSAPDGARAKSKSKKSSSKKDPSSKKRKTSPTSQIVTDAADSSMDLVSEPIAEPAIVSDSSEMAEKPKGSKKRKVESGEQLAAEPTSKKRRGSVEEIEVDVKAPEPPSKKDLRRLKKGKTVAPKSGADSTPEPEPKEKKKTAVEKRSEHSVWIGNLPWSATKDGLRKFLVEMSDITEEMITRVHMPGPNDSKPANRVESNRFAQKQLNKGFAYVDFADAKGVELAIELSETLMQGRRVLIKNSKSFEGRPEKPKEEVLRNDGKPASKRVFLGNLSYDVTEEILTDHFSKCGPVESVKVATFEDSGKCKGYAWIVFEELEAAESAVRGWTRIEEEASDESESDSDNDDEADEPTPKSKKPKPPKTRKWWVNKIQGRPLRMEFAEDAQVRYKKRYGGKERRDNKHSQEISTSTSAPVTHTPTNAQPSPAPTSKDPSKFIPKSVAYRQEYAPRLTGGIVESRGKEITF